MQGRDLQDNDVDARNGEPHPAIPDPNLISMPPLPERQVLPFLPLRFAAVLAIKQIYRYKIKVMAYK